MYRVDITADLNDEDETGYVWTFLDEARDPEQIKPGALLVVGDEDTAAVCEVIDVAGCAQPESGCWQGAVRGYLVDDL